MRWLRVLVLRIRTLVSGRRLDAETLEEIRQHLDRQIEANLAAGMSDKDARRAAALDVGNVAQLAEAARKARGPVWWVNQRWSDKVRILLLSTAAAYLFLLCFPQVLFAYEINYKNFRVYSTTPLDREIYSVLDRADARLSTSAIQSSDVAPSIFLLNSTQLYAVSTMYVGGNSFAKSFGALPVQNVFVNAHDLATDLVFRDAPAGNQRSLSGVIAHETTHLLVRRRYGYLKNLMLPTWKKEGYAEYVAGASTLSYQEGVRLWRASPQDASGYQYFRYHMMVKYLLEHEKLTVDEMFNRDFDITVLAATVLKTL